MLTRTVLGCALLIGALGGVHAAPTLRLSDGVNTVVVVDNGPGDLFPLDGYVLYSGPVGPNWVVNVSTGITKPVIGSATEPYMDLNTKNQSVGAGTLTIEFSDDSFGPVDGEMFVLVGGQINAGSTNSLSYSAFISDSNTLFGGDPLVPTMNFTGGGVYSDQTSVPLIRPANFALTQKVVIHHTNGGFSSADAVLDLTPRPPSGAIGDFVWKDLNGNGIQESGEPGIDGVTVTLTKDSTVIATTATSASGFYQFSGLAAGDYIVTVLPAGSPADGLLSSPTGAGTPATDSNANPYAVTLAAGESNQTVDFGFYEFVPPTGRIGDFVWEDVNQNGIQDAGEPGIGGVKVKLTNPSTGFSAETTTAANGSYLFTGLGAGNYEVLADTSSPSLTGYLPTFANEPGSTTANDSNVNPSPAQLLTDHSEDLTIDFGFIRTNAGTIGDYVWRDLNGDGIQGNSLDEPGIPGVTVQLFGPGNVLLATTTTDSDGYYLFEDLNAGTYYVSVVPSMVLEGFTYTLTTANAPGSTVANDSNPTPTEVVLPLNTSSNLDADFGFTPVPAGKIGDFVWHDVDEDGLQDAGEPGIGGVTVRLLSSADVVLATTITAPNGSYLFTGLMAGTYKVAADSTSPSLAGFAATIAGPAGSPAGDDSNPNPSTVTLASNTSSDLTQDFGYVQLGGGKIGDYVWNDADRDGIQDASEVGINGVTVKLYSAAPYTLLATTVTSGNGSYLFSGLKAGNYIVVVETNSPALSGFYASPSFATGNAAAGNDSNGSPATVSLATNTSCNLTIDFGFYLPPSVFTTFTMGGWGTEPSGNNPGALLKANFSKIYPKGLSIGGKYTLSFNSQLGIQNFLPCGTTPRALTKSYANPTTDLGALAGQVTALRLNVDFSNAGVLPGGLKNGLFVTGPFAGKTVGYVLALAESVLGGAPLPTGTSYSLISDACGLVNENYNEGMNSGFMMP